MLTLNFSIILITWLDINQNKVCVLHELKKCDSNGPIKIVLKVGFVFPLLLFCFAGFCSPSFENRKNKSKLQYLIPCTSLRGLDTGKEKLLYLISQLKPLKFTLYSISKLIDCLQICFHIAGWSAKNTGLTDMFEYNSLEIKEPENVVVNIKR